MLQFLPDADCCVKKLDMVLSNRRQKLLRTDPVRCVTSHGEETHRNLGSASRTLETEESQMLMRVTFQKLLRVAAGYSQKEIADLLGIDSSLISRYESGRRPMPKALRSRFVAACAKRVTWQPLIREAQKS